MTTDLCKLANKYGTDKAIFYTPFYHELLADRRDRIKKVLEMGIGYPECMRDSLARIGASDYTAGASLFMWREYFPNAEIYGLDNNPKSFVGSERIRSFYCDQGDAGSYVEAIRHVGAEFDLIIDDGCHVIEYQLMAMRMLMPLLRGDGIYIMEDISGDYDALLSQIPYPHKLVRFSRTDLAESNTAAVVVIRKH